MEEIAFELYLHRWLGDSQSEPGSRICSAAVATDGHRLGGEVVGDRQGSG